MWQIRYSRNTCFPQIQEFHDRTHKEISNCFCLLYVTIEEVAVISSLKKKQRCRSGKQVFRLIIILTRRMEFIRCINRHEKTTATSTMHPSTKLRNSFCSISSLKNMIRWYLRMLKVFLLTITWIWLWHFSSGNKNLSSPPEKN